MGWKTTGSPHQILENNEIIRKSFQIAQVMNKYFYDKIKNIRSIINIKEWNPSSCRNIMNQKHCKLYMQFVPVENVRKLLRCLSNSKSTAVDGLNNYSLNFV